MTGETDAQVEAFIMGEPTGIIKGGAERAQLKPGYKTTEFWFSALGGILPWVVTSMPPAWQVAVSAGAGAVYSIARGLAKLGIGR